MSIDILQHKTNEHPQDSEGDPSSLADKVVKLLSADGGDGLKIIEQSVRALNVASAAPDSHVQYAFQHASQLSELGKALGGLLMQAEMEQPHANTTDTVRGLGSVAIEH